MSKLKFKVFNSDGKDVTDLYDWYIDKDGNLYYETNDIDMPLYNVDDFTYEVKVE